MDVVPIVTLPSYSIYPSCPAKYSQEKNHIQKVKELGFTEKKELQITREKFFFLTKRRD